MGRRGRPRSRLGGNVAQHGSYGGYKLREALTGVGGDGYDTRALEYSAFESVFNVGGHKLDPLFVHEVALGESDDTPGYSKQVENGEVFTSLRHYRLIGGDDEHREVYASNTGEHVVDKALVSRDIDDTDLVAAREFEPREAKVYRQAAFLLLGEPVRVNAGQSLNESGFAVVNVACGAYNEHELYLGGMVSSV